jgi:hypothetical protein
MAYADIIKFDGKNWSLAVKMAEAFDYAMSKLPGRNNDQGVFIIEEQTIGADEPNFYVEIAGGGGKGNNCAHDKLYTLQQFPNITSTGELALQIGEEDIDDAVGLLWQNGFAPIHGGLQFPFTDQKFAREGVPYEIYGTTRIAYSGFPNDVIDVFVLLTIFKAYVAEDKLTHQDTNIYFDLSGVKKDLVAGTWCNIIGL